jgi:hypothetical protein
MDASMQSFFGHGFEVFAGVDHQVVAFQLPIFSIKDPIFS